MYDIRANYLFVCDYGFNQCLDLFILI